MVFIRAAFGPGKNKPNEYLGKCEDGWEPYNRMRNDNILPEYITTPKHNAPAQLTQHAAVVRKEELVMKKALQKGAL